MHGQVIGCRTGYKMQFTTCTNPIIHLFYPPKICIGIVFDFSWDIFMSQEKLQTMVMKKFWGVIEVYYGIVQVVNTEVAMEPAMQ